MTLVTNPLDPAMQSRADGLFRLRAQDLADNLIRELAEIDSDHTSRGLYNSSARLSYRHQANRACLRAILEERIRSVIRTYEDAEHFLDDAAVAYVEDELGRITSEWCKLLIQMLQTDSEISPSSFDSFSRAVERDTSSEQARANEFFRTEKARHDLKPRPQILQQPEIRLMGIDRTMQEKSPGDATIFVSYSNDSPEHAQRVLGMTQELRVNGLDAHIDQFVQSPPEGWPLWMQRRIEEARFVLLVCTPTYKRRFEGREIDEAVGLGATWEGFLTAQLLYQNRALNHKCVPVLWNEGSTSDIPTLLSGSSHYRYPQDFEKLLRRLTDQPDVKPATLGPLPNLPPMSSGATSSSLTRAATPSSSGRVSKDAMLIVEFFSLASENGDDHDPAEVSLELLQSKSSLLRDDLIDALYELEEGGYVVLRKHLNAGPPGFDRASPTASLFAEFDKLFMSWDPKADALAIAQRILQGEGVVIQELASEWGWTTRRMNPAVTYLENSGLVQVSETLSFPWVRYWVAKNGLTRRWVKSATVDQ